MRAPRNEFAGETRGPGTGKVNPFRPVVIMVVILISLFGFAAAVTLAGWADELSPDDNRRAHALSVSGVGFAGLVQLLQDTGTETRFQRRVDDSFDDGSPMIVTLDRPVGSSTLRDFRYNSNTLIVLPKWQTTTLDRRTTGVRKDGWVEKVPFGDSLYSERSLSGVLEMWVEEAEIDRLKTRKTLKVSGSLNADKWENSTAQIDHLQYLSGTWNDEGEFDVFVPTTEDEDETSEDSPEDDESVENTDAQIDNTYTVDLTVPFRILPILELDRKPVFFALLDADGNRLTHILTDPDLLNTQGLETRSRARLAVDIIEHMRTYHSGDDSYDVPVTFDLSLHGFATAGNIIKTLTTPPFLAATLILLATIGLLIWSAFSRFGDPIDVEDGLSLGKRTLIENGAELIGTARRTLSLRGAYGRLQRRQAIKTLRLEGAPEDKITATLARHDEAFANATEAVSISASDGDLLRASQALHDRREALSQLHR